MQLINQRLKGQQARKAAQATKERVAGAASKAASKKTSKPASRKKPVGSPRAAERRAGPAPQAKPDHRSITQDECRPANWAFAERYEQACLQVGR